MTGSPPGDGLRGVRLAALAMAASLLIAVALSVWAVPALGRWPLPASDPLVWPLVGTALILILLSSRLRTVILRRARRALPPADEATSRAALAAAYGRASLASLALLEAAGLLGLLVSFLSGTARYGVVFGLAGLFAMLTRWPRRWDLERLLAGRFRP